MDTASFLRRVVPPGNFLAISHTFVRSDGKPVTPGVKPFSNRFYRYEDVDKAASFLAWQASQANDAYYALASYKLAIKGTTQSGREKYTGERKHTNVQSLKAFWIDLDVSRPGDGKKPADVWATRADARTWLKGFLHATGMLPPNLMVNSGYGYHAYWVVDTPMPRDVWQPYADALRTALVAQGFRGDPGISADSARILRPPNTYNLKSGSAEPVSVVEKYTQADYSNQLIYAVLQPYVGVATMAAPIAAAGGAQGASALAGGGGTVQSIFAGRQTAGSMTNAMQTGVSSARPRHFAKIAVECKQVELSLANHGNGEGRRIWYLGNITLAAFCDDGADFIHLVGDGDPRYTAAETDALFSKAQQERRDNNNGPPTCAHYDKERPGVCQGCPHFGEVTTPWNTGLAAPVEDLPDNYQRGPDGNSILVGLPVKNGVKWERLIAGDIGSPLLNMRSKGGFAFRFIYYNDDRAYPIYVTSADLADVQGLFKTFEVQNLLLVPGMEAQWRVFVLAWIDQLRNARKVIITDVAPFGWLIDKTEADAGTRMGFAVSGTLYRADKTQEPTSPPDPVLLRDYTPAGTLAAWQRATKFIMAGRPDLQLIVAVAFGAPLMNFTGLAGVVFNAWSENSGVGKSSAMAAGCAVWASEAAMNALKDTDNAVLKRIGDCKSMPSWWDEMRASNKERSQQLADLLLSMTQGKGKARLGADTTLREVGAWETILMCASNYPIMEHVLAATSGTDAGAVRLYEWGIHRASMAADVEADNIVQLLKYNHGRAGRIYAEWIAAHAESIAEIMKAQKAQLSARLTPDHSERFLIAGMVSCLVGARIANKRGLCAFDVPALQAFLEQEFLRMRDERAANTLIGAGKIDIEAIFTQFMADHNQHKLVTKNFLRVGVRKLDPQDLLWHPKAQIKATIHIGQADRAMWVSRPAFLVWCHNNGLPGRPIIDAMEQQWQAVVDRRNPGGGTEYSVGKTACIIIPLLAPPLSDYLHVAAVQPAAAPTPGNQPKV